ncbi:MAG: hypothetical protein J6S51_02010 [Kiritimatiellae bacterium]|nr:hypothetical protein [Kiritimatiellia bacterium]
MKKTTSLIIVILLCNALNAAWYWPFGSDDDKPEKPKLSELVEQASIEIDDAVEAAAQGDLDKALEHYRKALQELDRVERENPAIAPLPEYSSLRNKRAYVNAAIDSILLEQSKDNAKAVQVTNTTELEKKFEARRLARKGGKAPLPAVKKETVKTEEKVAKVEKDQSPRPTSVPTFSKAEIEERLNLRPDDAKALNMRAMMEAKAGDFKAAEETLYRAIMTNPRSYHAYYNMAALILKFRPESRDAARRYYETGRNYGGPQHKILEKEFE